MADSFKRPAATPSHVVSLKLLLLCLSDIYILIFSTRWNKLPPLTKHDGQHLCGFFLPRVHAPEPWIIDVRQRRGPQRRVRPSVGQVLHLTAHPDRRKLRLLVVLPVLLPPTLIQVQLCAATGGVADAAVVVRVHWGQHRVLLRSRFGAFAPQAARE